jgi:hypothetical protein
MSRIDVKQIIRIYEADGEDVDMPMGVNSYSIDDNMVVLVVGGHTYVVHGDDIKTAVDNAMNSGGT